MARQPHLVLQVGLLLLGSLSSPGQTRPQVAVVILHQAASTLEPSARVTMVMLEELLHLEVFSFHLGKSEVLQFKPPTQGRRIDVRYT